MRRNSGIPRRNAIITAQVIMPIRGTKGTHGVLNARGASGMEYRIIQTSATYDHECQQGTNAGHLPTTLTGTRCGKQTYKHTEKDIRFQEYGNGDEHPKIPLAAAASLAIL